MGSFWNEFKRAGREMYQIPEGVSAARFIASLPADYVKHVRGEAVSAAYSAKRTKALQRVMDFQAMGGASRERIENDRGGDLPRGYFEAKSDAHQALEDFPEIRAWINEDAIR